MDRKKEYDLLIKELEEVPIALEYSVPRIQARVKNNRWHQWLGVPLGGGVAFLFIFTLLVNSVPLFAQSCSRIPLIKELVRLVDFSPSLSTAVDHDYVQPIEKEQTINDITARIEYLIVDQKQVNVFYTLDSKMYHNMEITPRLSGINGVLLEGYSVSSGNYGTPNGELNYMTIDFVEQDVPDQFSLIMQLHDNGDRFQEAVIIEDNEMNLQERHELPTPISTFTFDLELDPYYTAQGEKLIIGEQIVIDGQRLTLEEAEIYPTHMRITFDDEQNNTAYLTSMSYYIENEKGKRFNKITNGITATGKKDSPMMASYRLESAFFSQSKELTLYITDVEWLDKDKQRVKLDLVNKTAEYLPQGVTFENAERKENGWYLTFGAEEYKENSTYDIWRSNYYDEEEKEYTYNSWSTHSETYEDEQEEKDIQVPKMFSVNIPLINYPYDTVYMLPNFSRHVQLEEPVAIKIK